MSKLFVREHLSLILCAGAQYREVIELYAELPTHYPPVTFAYARGLAYAHNGLGVFDESRQMLKTMLEKAVLMNWPDWQVQCLPDASLIAAHEGELERAAELRALSFHHPAVATGWLEKFPLVVRLRERLGKGLENDTFEAAWERGKSLDLAETVEKLLAG